MAARTVISEGSLLPVSFVVILMTMGFSAASLYTRVAAAESAIVQEQDERVRTTTRVIDRLARSEQTINETHAGVARLEGKMDVLLRSKGRP